MSTKYWVVVCASTFICHESDCKKNVAKNEITSAIVTWRPKNRSRRWGYHSSSHSASVLEYNKCTVYNLYCETTLEIHWNHELIIIRDSDDQILPSFSSSSDSPLVGRQHVKRSQHRWCAWGVRFNDVFAGGTLMLISNCREMLLKPRIELRESKNKCMCTYFILVTWRYVI